jgi:DNA-binding MarR family transcriptional regulator
MEQIKEAFTKVKKDVFLLQEEIYFIKKDIESLKEIIEDLISFSKQIVPKKEEEWKRALPTQEENFQTEHQNIPTDNGYFKPLKHQNQGISIGNDGVPTDKQTNQQTNQQTDFSLEIEKKAINQRINSKSEPSEKKDSFKEAVSMLESLDNIKKELRLKFKKLTEQELLVFSTLYQLEEEQGYADYKTIALKLNLTESSIRDYIGKLIKKGIPVDKIKINNKSIQLKISPSLKKIATLPTILLLRDM